MQGRRFTFAVMALALMLGGRILAQQVRDTSAEMALQAAIKVETIDGDLKRAIELYRQLETSSNRSVAARALLREGDCYGKLGNAEARKAYERLVTRFADQKEIVAEARSRLMSNAAPATTRDGVVERVVAKSLPDCSNSFQVSSDGRTLAMLACDSDRKGLFLRDLSSGVDRLVPNTRDCVIGIVSRDARQAACVINDEQSKTLRLVQTDSGVSRTVQVKSDGSPYLTDWSPDGKTILARIWRQGRPWDLVVISVADGSLRLLKTGGGVGGGEAQPRFSPDGRFVVHSADRLDESGKPAARTIHVMSVEGSGEVPLIEGAATEKDTRPVWAPDGRRIAFVSDRSGELALWSVPVDNGRPAGDPVYLRAIGNDDPIGVTADGTVFWYRSRALVDVYVADIDVAAARVLSKPTRINQTFIGKSSGPLAWSPNGRSLAFTRTSGTKTLVVVRNLDSGEERELPNASNTPIAWLDDATLLAGSPIKRVDVKTGQAEIIPGLKQASGAVLRMGTTVALSADRTRVFFAVPEDEAPDVEGLRALKLVSQRLDGSDEKVVCRTKTRLMMLHSVAVSPDGRYVSFGVLLPSPGSQRKGQDGDWQAVIKVVPVEGGPERVMFAHSYWGADWSTDSRYLLVRGGPGDVQLFSIPLETGEIRPIGTPQVGVPMSLNPDGRRFAYVTGSYSEEIVALTNLLKPTTKKGR